MIEWEQQEPGWWTSEIGGILRSRWGGWDFWPADGSPRRGPWKTLQEAKAAVEYAWANVDIPR